MVHKIFNVMAAATAKPVKEAKDQEVTQPASDEEPK